MDHIHASYILYNLLDNQMILNFLHLFEASYNLLKNLQDMLMVLNHYHHYYHHQEAYHDYHHCPHRARGYPSHHQDSVHRPLLL